jgi:hypothetical protein
MFIYGEIPSSTEKLNYQRKLENYYKKKWYIYI